MKLLNTIPAFKFSIFFVAGILIGSDFLFNPLLLTLVIISFLIIILLFLYTGKSHVTCMTTLFLLIIMTGIYRANFDSFIKEENSVSIIPDTKRNLSITLTGVIKDIPELDSMKMRFLLECRSVISGSDTVRIEGDVLAIIRKDIYNNTKYLPPALEPGDLISLRGRLSEPAGRRNPGEFDYKNYLRVHDIERIFYVNGHNNVEVIYKYHLDLFHTYILFPAKVFVLNTIDKNYSGDEAGYLKGLVTGERGDISGEMKESFINAGVMHLIAVSGLNVAYIILSVTLMLSILRIPVLPRVIITIMFLIFYCMFTGNTASIVRASIMGILVLTALLLERRINFYNFLGIALITILIYDSKLLFDPGFILSFSATISMVIFYKQFEYLFINKIREWNASGKKLTLLIAVLFFTSLSAQIGTIPITAGYFGKISIISLLANVVAVPLANLSLAMGFLQILTAACSDYLSSVIAESINLLLYIQLLFIRWCASLDFAFMEVSEICPADIICYYLILIILISIKSAKQIAFRFVLCILVLCGLFVLKYDASEKLNVTYLDIGQGDCSIIQTPDRKVILVDCGGITLNSNSGERTITPYLKRKGIRKIDLLVITHLHLDHIGGINYLLQNIVIGKIIESGQKYSNSFIKTMDSLIEMKNIPREIVRSGDLIDDLKDIRLYFLFPDDKFINAEDSTIDNNLNNGSVAFILKYKSATFFFTGDIEKESEQYLNNTYSDFLDTDVLKVAHHGSSTSTTKQFLSMNKPEYAVISCGLFNKFDHPSRSTIDNLKNSGAIIMRTDIEGAIVLESDGKSIEQAEWK